MPDPAQILAGLAVIANRAIVVAIVWHAFVAAALLAVVWAGVASLAFGLVYPHFLDAHPAVYLFAAPLGLVPCPTLAAAIGGTLLGGGLGSRAFSLTLATLGLFYGVFGVLRLGVFLDVGLVLGAAALFLAAAPQREVRLQTRT